MPTYNSIHTAYGLQAMAAAEAAGTPINLTHMAVGDGNGNFVDLFDTMTALVNERFRAAINRVYQDPERNSKYTAELVIPVSVGGFTIREMGLFDVDGHLFAIGNVPASVKPAEGEGAFADTIVRFEFLVTNASVVTLQVDPNVAVATQSWILNNVTRSTLIPGGTTGQTLRKLSNADGDTEWADPDQANITIDTIEEKQELVDGQTVVTLAVCTTRGLALYVDGDRIPNDEWTPHPTDPTEFTFNTAIVGTHELICAQNEPTGSAPAPLERSKNLGDVESKSASRNNLDVFSRAEARQMAPSGLVAHFARSSAPTGWLKANGAAVGRVAYADLFAAIGTTFGAGDGFNTFNLPDLRGEFVRGWDDGRGVDAGRLLGSWQNAASPPIPTAGWDSVPGGLGTATQGTLITGSGTREISEILESVRQGTGSREITGINHPRNRALLACIKY
ncbi:MAG: phage tail protein [Halopseudomonas sp.]|uniref:phage tail-collar fiber domain-containing protein n=1 Tax=Halopseudomonas sp. TaxID=2901191 RepID=UPI0030020B5E